MAARTALGRAGTLCERFGLRAPILLAPMAGVPAPALSIAVGNAGGMPSCGVLLMTPKEMRAWADEVRRGTRTGFSLNLWVPDPPPVRDSAAETAVREFLSGWGPSVPAAAGDAKPPDFDAQCAAVLDIAPAGVSSVMGLFPPHFAAQLRRARIPWFAHVSTLAEAEAAADAGADVLVAQGMEAGGHRGIFDASEAERRQVGLMSLLPAIVASSHVRVPVVAAGGIVDGPSIAAALHLGASGVAIGTGFLP